MSSPTVRFQGFVRATFTRAREDLHEAIRKVIAQQSVHGLKNGATVKRIIQEFEEITAEAVAKCRAAATGSKPMRAHLQTVLFSEVDRLADQTTDALTRINLMDVHARQRLAKHRDRALVDLTPPTEPPSVWGRVKKALEPWTREIVVGSVLAVVGVVAARIFAAPPG